MNKLNISDLSYCEVVTDKNIDITGGFRFDTTVISLGYLPVLTHIFHSYNSWLKDSVAGINSGKSQDVVVRFELKNTGAFNSSSSSIAGIVFGSYRQTSFAFSFTSIKQRI